MAGATNRALKAAGHTAKDIRVIRTTQRVVSNIAALPKPGTVAKTWAAVSARLEALRADRAQRKAEPVKKPEPPKKQEPAKREAPRQTIADFSRDINHLAKHAKDGNWLNTKTFIDQVHRDYVRKHGDVSMDAFKTQLVAAARAGKILLSRADLVGAYPQHRLRDSQITTGGEAYHMIEHGWIR